MKTKAILSCLLCSCILAGCLPKEEVAPAPVIWKLDNHLKIGGLASKAICDAPSIKQIQDEEDNKPHGKGERGKALIFNGKSQGLLIPALPIAGCESFTIEVDIYPEAGGEFEQRFLHSGSINGARAMLELRSNPDGSWYLDSYLRDIDGNSLALIDKMKTHPSGRWYTVALKYDAETKKMSHYVNGTKEKEGTLTIAPLPDGCVSLGVRQNAVCWFKGMISEVRFWTIALSIKTD